ncbi:MAG: hypothetical protein R6X25_15205 [Candidatus Krumholzibacteriia bacterium]
MIVGDRARGQVSAWRNRRSRPGLDEWDEVFRCLTAAIDQRDPLVMPIKSYPWLDPVRDDPRYQELLGRMRLR